MKFKYRPEFVKEGETILLREGKTKIIGTITKVLIWWWELKELKDIKEGQTVWEGACLLNGFIEVVMTFDKMVWVFLILYFTTFQTFFLLLK